MKKFARLFCLLTALLFLAAAVPALTYSRQGILGGWKLVTSGTYAAGAGMFDLTTANAFTGCADLSAYQDGKHLLWASDGTNSLLARISATAPGGETLDVELVTNGDGESAVGWLTVDATVASVAGGEAGNCLELTKTAGVYQDLYRAFATVSGGLYLMGRSVKSGTSGNQLSAWGLLNTARTAYVASKNTTSSGSWAADTLYVTATQANQIIITEKNTSTAGTMLFDTLTAKRVLTPAATGALLLGSTGARGYINLSASFNPNAAGSFKVFKAY